MLLLEHFHDEMIEAGFLETLKKLMENLNVSTTLKYKFLSLMSSETADVLIKHNCIPSITSLLQSNDTQLKLMTLQILTKQCTYCFSAMFNLTCLLVSLQQLIESNLLPMLRLWLTGEEVKQNPDSEQVYTNPFMNAWAYGVVSTLADGILTELLVLLMSIAKSGMNTNQKLFAMLNIVSDVTAFCAEDLLSPVVKLLRHPSEDVYRQAGEIIDYIQSKLNKFKLSRTYTNQRNYPRRCCRVAT